MTVDEWLRIGWEHGWCSPPVCSTHDGIPATDDEYEDDEPCTTVVRVYRDDEHRRAVERDFAPAVWRASNRGWSRPQH